MSRPLRRAVWVLVLAAAGATHAGAADSMSLPELLTRLSRTASLFRDTALQFACREKIAWRGVGTKPGSHEFEYVFVHDEERGFRDYRTSRFLGRRRSAPPEVVPESVGVPMYLRSAYLWIFAFRESRQELHRYRIRGTERILGVDAVVVEFEPIPPYQKRVNDWFGVAWVDPELGQILKVVAQRPTDHETQRKLEDTLGAGIVDEVEAEWETVTTLYTEEKNGLRFPGEVTLDHSRYTGEPKQRQGTRKKTLLRVTQTYRKYQFFSVRTAEEIEAYLKRGQQP